MKFASEALHHYHAYRVYRMKVKVPRRILLEMVLWVGKGEN